MWGSWALVVVSVAVGWLLIRLRHLPVASVVVVVFSAVLLGTPVVQSLLAYGSQIGFPGGEHLVDISSEDGHVRDVWFIVLDAYPSQLARQEYATPESQPLESFLRSRGFVVNPSALAPYATTIFSVPTLLEGEYVATEEHPTFSYAVARRIVSGDNNLVYALQGVGYATTIVESGWRVSGCEVSVNHCVRSPFIDEPVATILGEGVVGGLAGIDRSTSFAYGAANVLDWLDANVSRLGGNGERDLVIAHVLAPHPPLALDSSCTQRNDPRGSGLVLWLPQAGRRLQSLRREMYYEQAACVDSRISSFVDRIDDEAIVGIVGDHGPDSLGQFGYPIAEWTHEMIRERMLTLAAVRLPIDCPTEIRAAIEVSQKIMKCVANYEPASSGLQTYLSGERSILTGELLQLNASDVSYLLQYSRRAAGQLPSAGANRSRSGSDSIELAVQEPT